MVVSEGAINNIMGGMENTAGVRLHSHRHKLKQRFDIIRKLGQGTYGKVQLAVNKETGQEVAIKTIKKAKIETEQDLIRIRREIQIMSSVQHPQIIHIYEVFENREKMVLVMEYAAGGELYDYLSERKVLSEDEARRVFRHVASATYYCHKHKICHRDLKLENILLDLDGNAKIADFGLSNVFAEKHRLDTFCGSPLYASPEIVKGIPYTGPEVDCWSLGVLLYTLVYGAMPFDGSNFKRLVKQITQGDYYEPKMPSRASELIRHMLTVNASKRATVEEICCHWWVNEGFSDSCLDVAEALANQTPVRLDLLLSLAPKHIDSEHMLIPEEDDSGVRSPSNSESSRPPPNLNLPPPPQEEDPPAQQVTATRSASLGALSSVNSNEIEALVAQKMQQKKEEVEVEEEEQKRKGAKEAAGTDERRKKKRDASDASLKSARKEQKRSEETSVSVRHPEGDSGERKKAPSRRKEAPLETEEVDKSGKRKSGEKKKPDSLITVDGEVSDSSEREKRRSMRKAEKEKEKAEGEKVEKKKTVRRKESGVEKDASGSEGGAERTGRKSFKKGDVGAMLESSVERKLEKKKDASGENLTRKDSSTSEFASTSVINGEAGEGEGEEKEEEEEEVVVKRESGIGKGESKSESTKPDSVKVKPAPASRGSAEGKARLGELQESPMEVEEDAVKKSASKSRSEESKQPKEGTLKASGSSGSRDTVGPAKQSGGAAPSPTASTQESPRKKSSPPPPGGATTQPPKVSDARKAFETKPADKPSVVLRKKPSLESSPSSPTSAKDGPVLSSSSELVKGKSPAKEKPLPAKEVGKAREKSPKIGKESSSKVGSKVKAEAETGKKVEELAKKEKAESTKKIVPSTAAMQKSSKADKSLPLPPEGSQKPATNEKKEEAPRKVEKPTKSESKQILSQRGSSESSESESEAEKLLKVVSEKREKIEAAKQEKLRKVSSTKEPQMEAVAASKEPQSPTKVSFAKSPSKPSPSKSPEKTANPLDAQTQEQKFATLPRGFKTKSARPNAAQAVSPTPSTTTADHPRKDRGAINEEIEGMMSAIKAVDQAITKGPNKAAQKTSETTDTDRKKSKLEIVLNSKQPEAAAKRASYAEIKLTSPTSKEPPRTPGFRSEVCAKVEAVPAEPTPVPKHGPGPGAGPVEAQLQRAKRERIIPIMLVDDDEDEDTTATDSHLPLDTHSWRFGPSVSAISTPLSSQLPNSHHSEPRSPPVCTPAPEPIRKSRRERIIPIAIEGEDVTTPPLHTEEGAGTGQGIGAARIPQPYSRTLSGRPTALGASRGSGFLLDHSESFSSAGEEEEEDEDDGFQILTAESLFSTLLNRVRSLTRKMNAEDGRGTRRTPNRPTPEPGGPAGMSGAVHSGSTGFWSQLYNSPHDSTGRRISEVSRGSLARDEDGMGGLGSPLWNRSVSRDPSDADTLFSEPSSASHFGTLPRVNDFHHSLHLPPPRLHSDSFLSDF